MRNTRLSLSFLLASLLLMAPSSMLFAQVMQGTVYKIMTDSVNNAGTNSSSTNYIMGDTLGELGTGDSNSATYYMHAGYWQTLESYISISSPADLALTPIGGINASSTEGVLSWTVTTDNAAGYTMTVNTLTVPALKSAADSFADYAPVGADPDYNFSILNTASAFGFSPEGTDTATRFQDNGSACNTGSGETSGKCWDGLSTTPKTIAGKTTSNHPAGSTVSVRFRAASGAAHIQTSGSYAASIVVTAVVL